jgi:hypothetical protein
MLLLKLLYSDLVTILRSSRDTKYKRITSSYFVRILKAWYLILKEERKLQVF